MATRLVVNADDLGLHPEIDAGILRAHRDGIVTSATVLVMGASAPQAVRAAREAGLALGVHLALSTGLRPAAPAHEVPNLAPGGRFRASWSVFARDWLAGKVPAAELTRELTAQLDRAHALDLRPDHLDVHQHLHVLPGVRQVVESLAQREGLPIRWPCQWPSLRSWRETPTGAVKEALLWGLGQLRWRPRLPRRVRGVGVAHAGRLTEPSLLALIDRLPDGPVELGCHPGHGKPLVPEDPPWQYAWEAECDALCSPAVRKRLRERNVTLTTYGAL